MFYCGGCCGCRCCCCCLLLLLLLMLLLLFLLLLLLFLWLLLLLLLLLSIQYFECHVKFFFIQMMLSFTFFAYNFLECHVKKLTRDVNERVLDRGPRHAWTPNSSALWPLLLRRRFLFLLLRLGLVRHFFGNPSAADNQRYQVQCYLSAADNQRHQVQCHSISLAEAARGGVNDQRPSY